MGDSSDETRSNHNVSPRPMQDSQDITLQLCGEEEDDRAGARATDWSTILQTLRRPANPISLDFWRPGYMDLPSSHMKTMDAFSKSWRNISPNSPELLHSEVDGGSWIFCESCVAEIPLGIQKTLYFFHTLLTSVKNYKMYAVPTAAISLRYKRGDKKTISEMVWNKEMESGISPVSSPGEEAVHYFDINKATATLSQQSTNSVNVPVAIPPFKIRLGMTGAFYNHNGQQHRKLVSVLVITWARNWDMLGYIQHEFLAEPDQRGARYLTRAKEVRTMRQIWKTILLTAAFKHLGIDETRFGVPEDYMDNRGGELGVDWLLNIFQLPFHVLGIIKQDILTAERRLHPCMNLSDIHIDALRIIGMPTVPWELQDMETDHHVTYMREYVINLSNEYVDFSKQLRAFYKPKRKAKGEEGDEPEDDGGMLYDPAMSAIKMRSPGLWPLEMLSGEYTKFGLPPLPMWLAFSPEMEPSINGTFETWLIDVGGANGLPELNKACMRSFWVQDLNASRELIYQTWDMFLKDKRRANPELVYNTYYGENADPLASLATAGYLRPWWVGVVKDIEGQRKRALSPIEAAESFGRYLSSSILYHKSAMTSGAFRSTRVTQAMQIIERTDYRKSCIEQPESMKNFITMLVDSGPRQKVFDRYQRCNEAFWKCFEKLNRSFLMNSSNLEFMVEIMISQIMWMLGAENETFVGYFQGITQLSGNGHFSLSTKEGTFPDKRKPNSTGADFTRERLSELFQMLLDRVGITNKKENLQAPRNCMGWTMASIPLATHATVTDGRVESLPDKQLVLTDFMATEIRGKGECPTNSLIKFVIPRNANGQDQVSLNTCDPDHSNMRKQQFKRKITDLQFCAIASNVPDQNAEEAEMSKTLNAVLHAMVPGSAPTGKKRRAGEFNDIACNAYGGRNNAVVNTEGIINLLPYSHVWACNFPALMNKMGMIPFEISKPTLALWDWLFLYIKENAEGILDRSVAESFKRMKDGYEARQVAKSLWIKSIMYLSSSSDEEEATARVMQSMFVNAVPVYDAIGAAHSFLTRGIHMGCLLMISAIASHLKVPIIPIDNLRTFFDEENEPAQDGEDRITFNLIKNWLTMCAGRNRFCPENPHPFNTVTNICPYITSNGDESGLPIGDTMLRVKKSNAKATQDEVFQGVAQRIHATFGEDLFSTCRMGPEICIYRNALMDLTNHWNPDFRQLISRHMFSIRRLNKKMGFDVTMGGIMDWPVESSQPPPFARAFSFIYAGEPNSFAIGVHWAGLLACVSLADGAIMHPKISSNMSRSVLREILRHSPPCATPGNNVLIRAFNVDNSVTERIILSHGIPRPYHFIRPVDDSHFVNTGTFTYARAIGSFLPEDVMHCGALLRYAELYACPLLELPAKAIDPEYELLLSTPYCLWSQERKSLGTITLDPRTGKADITMGDDMALSSAHDEWDKTLKRMGFIILPMIWRQGACICIEEDGLMDVACIVPYTTGSNFSPGSLCYRAKLTEEKIIEVFAHEVITKLIPVGTEVFVRLYNDRVRRLVENKLPRPSDRARNFLSARLNIPTIAEPEPGKVYVSCILKAATVRHDAACAGTLTLVLNPWEISLVVDEEEERVPNLVSRS